MTRHHPHPLSVPCTAFTLIEMMVVMSIIIVIMATGVPAMISAQRQSDVFFTPNIIASVHAASQRNAKQFGSAALVYGFTLSYTTSINGQPAADAITPWMVDAGGVVRRNSDINLKSTIGLSEIWHGNSLQFRDLYRPCGQVAINGSNLSISSNRHLHVAYAPITGFPHTALTPSDDFTPSPSDALASEISKPDRLPQQIKIVIANESGTPRNTIVIQKTGVCDVRGAP
jgi:prepilin-type N-terminal cleavage/methylation domain-containing protein